jgi:hypothetical protein
MTIKKTTVKKATVKKPVMQKGGVKESNLSRKQNREIKYTDKMRNKQLKRLEKEGTSNSSALVIDVENKKASYGPASKKDVVNEKADSTIKSLKLGTLLPGNQLRYNPGTRTHKKGGAIKMAKGGTVAKAQSGLSIGQGPNNTVAKSNIGPKIAAAIGSATTATGVAVNKLKKKRQAKLEKLKNEQTPEKKKGGSTGDKKWIQKAINPKHKGFCTPMTKPTCTPKRKALAKTLKAMAKKR